jgi:hypothetical protein
MADVIFLIDNVYTNDQRQIIVLREKSLIRKKKKNILHLKLLFDQGQFFVILFDH